MATDVLLIAEARIATVQLLEQLLSYLDQNTTLRARSRLLNELQPEDFTPETFPLIVRSIDPVAHDLTKMLRRIGVQYGYYIDDNFWLLDPDTEIGRHYASAPERRRLESVVRNASIVIASTPLLGEYLRSHNDHIVQLDSFFDFSLIPELPPAPPTRPLVRGGFAATADRAQDLRPIFNDVLEALDEQENLEFEIIGAAATGAPAHPRIRYFSFLESYTDYVSFLRSRQWDFALAPLGAAASNLYKTDNKFREYAAQGIPGIYQDAPPYLSVRDGETGLLAGASRSWRAAIHEYVARPGLRGRVRRDARVDVENRSSLERVAPQWQKFFESAPQANVSALQNRKIRWAFRINSSWVARAIQRWNRLWAHGRSEVAASGLISTMGKTARFLQKRAKPR